MVFKSLMVENKSHNSDTGKELVSKPSFCYSGDIYFDEEKFLGKLTKNACIWFEFPTMTRQEACYLFREKGDLSRSFAMEYGNFVTKINEMIKLGKKLPDTTGKIRETTPAHYA